MEIPEIMLVIILLIGRVLEYVGYVIYENSLESKLHPTSQAFSLQFFHKLRL